MTSKHDTDFFGWTQQQAGLLRGLSVGDSRLDVENLADEIEGLGDPSSTVSDGCCGRRSFSC